MEDKIKHLPGEMLTLALNWDEPVEVGYHDHNHMVSISEDWPPLSSIDLAIHEIRTSVHPNLRNLRIYRLKKSYGVVWDQ